MTYTLHKAYEFIFSVVTVAFVAVSCTADSDNNEQGLAQLNLLQPSIAVTAKNTRSMPVDGTAFPWKSISYLQENYATYAMGFWICDKGTYSPHMQNYDNKKLFYRIESDNTFSWREDGPNGSIVKSAGIRLGKSIDVYVYYPYQDQTKVPFTPETVPFTTNQQADWMWADPVHIDNITAGSKDNNLQLLFHHAMTCIEVRLSTRYDGTITLANIKLEDAKKQLVKDGTMDIRNGMLTYNADQSEITISGNNNIGVINYNTLPTTGSEYRSYCFLMPEKSFDAGDLTMTFYFDADKKQARTKFTVPSRFKNANGSEVSVAKLETGKKYVLNLVIDNSLKITPVKFSQEDWTAVDINLKI